MLLKSLLFIKQHSFILFAFLIGFNIAYALPKVVALAHGGTTDLVHVCVKSANGSMRLVGPNDTCGSSETPLDWPATFGSGSGGPKIIGSRFSSVSDHFAGQDLSHTFFAGAQFNEANLTETNFSFDIFDGAYFRNSNLTNANLSNSQFGFDNGKEDDSMTNLDYISGVGADFSNSTFHQVAFRYSDLSNSNFSNTTFDSIMIFVDTNLTGANFSGVNMSPQVYSAWYNTICPDGTNSDNNGNTCVGHL